MIINIAEAWTITKREKGRVRLLERTSTRRPGSCMPLWPGGPHHRKRQGPHRQFPQEAKTFRLLSLSCHPDYAPGIIEFLGQGEYILLQSIESNPLHVLRNFQNRIVIVISKFLKRCSKAKRTRAPTYSRALQRIKGGLQRGVRGSSGPISRVPGGTE